MYFYKMGDLMKSNISVSLKIIDAPKLKLIKKIFIKFIPNRPKVKEVESEGIISRDITYKKRDEKINWKKISDIIKKDSNYVLCDKKIRIPAIFGIQRFSSNKLYRRFCQNAALHVIENMEVNKKELKVTVYDPRGAYLELVEKLLCHLDQLQIVSNNIDYYEAVREKLIEEYKVNILLNDNILSVSDSNIVIAPDKIRVNLNLSEDAIVFTAEPSSIDLNCNVIDKYKVNMPIKYKILVPDYIEDEYFLSYLYSEYRLYDLGLLVPVYCIVGNQVKSISTLF